MSKITGGLPVATASQEGHQLSKLREWMGVEPTAARSARPATDFEDRGSHRAPTTPKNVMRGKDSATCPISQVGVLATGQVCVTIKTETLNK